MSRSDTFGKGLGRRALGSGLTLLVGWALGARALAGETQVGATFRTTVDATAPDGPGKVFSHFGPSPIFDPWAFHTEEATSPFRNAEPAWIGKRTEDPVSTLPQGPKEPVGAPRANDRPPEKSQAKRDPISALTDRDKKVLAEAAERIAQKLVPWLDFKLLRKLDILKRLQLANAEFRWNVIQKPGFSMMRAGRSGSPIVLQGRTSLQMVKDRWNLSWQIDHPIDGLPHMEMKSQIWSKDRFHADVGYGFATNEHLREVLQQGAFATLGMRIGIHVLDYSYREQDQQHLVSLATVF